jgi:hypothetical protein
MTIRTVKKLSAKPSRLEFIRRSIRAAHSPAFDPIPLVSHEQEKSLTLAVSAERIDVRNAYYDKIGDNK